ncbi:unnamed protein product [Prorocentrum cordatum]|uniref:Mei2-like C-terminal RNA recognition motif domain-containing protein n=1 Tax=Prorocentrum cordatum TaxID=2364126 RepID=A0ABN9Y445_9DINO|nr:unnamed protein product [Polarella glacialis]
MEYGACASGEDASKALKRQLSMEKGPSVYKVHAALATGYCLFAGGAIVGKFGVHGSSAIIFELFREFWSLIALSAGLFIFKVSPVPAREDVPTLLLGGTAFFFNQVFWFVALKLADPVTGSAWQTFLPILTALLSVILGQTKLEGLKACREGAAGAPRQARGRQGAAEAAGGRPPLAELVRRHGLPEVDPDLRLDEGITTMVIVNVPYAYPRQMLQADINEWGFPYNYFHCPQDSRQGRSRGLAFINFLTPLAAAAFKRCFDKRELSCPGAEAQVVTVLPSRLQGLEKNAQLHPEGRVLDPHWQLHQHRQRTRHFDSSSRRPPAASTAAGEPAPPRPRGRAPAPRPAAPGRPSAPRGAPRRGRPGPRRSCAGCPSEGPTAPPCPASRRARPSPGGRLETVNRSKMRWGRFPDCFIIGGA